MVTTGHKLFIGLLALSIVSLLPLSHLKFWNYEFPTYQHVMSNLTRCAPPLIHPWNPDIRRFYRPPLTVNCAREMNKNSTEYGVVAFAIQNGNELLQLVKFRNNNVSCCYQPLQTISFDKEKFELSKYCTRIQSAITELPSSVEFIKVECKLGQKVVHRDAFPVVHPNPLKDQQPLPSRTSSLLNILILGMDGVSRLNFVRHMPQSNDYLLYQLDAISLNGQSIISRGTHNNLIPLFTGKSIAEFSRVCSVFNEKCRYVWHRFPKELGYLTAFAHDGDPFYTFWRDQFLRYNNEDYFLGPFSFYSNGFCYQNTPSHYCYGTRLAFKTILNYVEAIQHAAKKVNRPYFAFTWSSRLAHDNMNDLGIGNLPLLKQLRRMKESGALNNTVLLVMGDHGTMKSSYYGTPSGKREYLMPLAYVVLPPWFKNRYPEKYANLQDNRRKMTATYDLFKTLWHLSDLDNWKDNATGLGISLFNKIPGNRKCLEAGTSLKWCNLCYPKKKSENNDIIAKVGAELVIKMINDKIQGKSKLCGNQSLRHVNNTMRWDPRDVYLEYCNLKGEFDRGKDDYDTAKTHWNISCEAEDSVEIATLEVTTNPSGATYLAEVMMIWNKTDRFYGKKPRTSFLIDDLVRLDQYKYVSRCLGDYDYYSLKPYCICKNTSTPK